MNFNRIFYSWNCFKSAESVYLKSKMKNDKQIMNEFTQAKKWLNWGRIISCLPACPSVHLNCKTFGGIRLYLNIFPLLRQISNRKFSICLLCWQLFYFRPELNWIEQNKIDNIIYLLNQLSSIKKFFYLFRLIENLKYNWLFWREVDMFCCLVFLVLKRICARCTSWT